MTITGASKFTAIGAVVIGGNQECGFWINRFTIKRQVFDALSFVINQRAFAVIASRLADINFIVNPIDNIEIISTETIPVNQ